MADLIASVYPRSRPNLRERRRTATRMDVAQAAMSLFLDRGYEAVTVGDIAAAAGISLRTFYRYCPRKEDAVSALLGSVASAFVDVLRARPAGEPLEVAARHAFDASLVRDRVEGERQFLRVILGEPDLRARWHASNADARAQIAPILAARMDVPEGSLPPIVAAALLTSAFETASEAWAEHDGVPIEDAVDVALAMVMDGLGGPPDGDRSY